MSVQRLSIKAYKTLISGKVKENETCVVKFYSNGCHMCHALSPYYEEIAKDPQYEKIHFLAFNIDDYPDAEKELKFNGVPTIFIIHTNTGNRKPTFRLLEDPENPNEKTWYRVRDIKNFIKREAL